MGAVDDDRPVKIVDVRQCPSLYVEVPAVATRIMRWLRGVEVERTHRCGAVDGHSFIAVPTHPHGCDCGWMWR